MKSAGAMAVMAVLLVAACGPRGGGPVGPGPEPVDVPDAGVAMTTVDGGAPGPVEPGPGDDVDGDAEPEPMLEEIDPALLGDLGSDVALEPAIARAETALASGQWDRAIAAARGALAIDADEPRAIAALARAFAGKGWWDSARAVLDNVLSVNSKPALSGALWYLAGWTSHHLGENARALEELGRAVKLRKDDAAAWNLMGVVHLDRAQPVDAVQALETARTHAPDSIAILTNLGSAYRRAASNAITVGEADELLRKAEKSYLSALGAGLGRGRGYAAAYLGLGLLYLDAISFPDLDQVERLQSAVQYLSEVESIDAPDLDQAAVDRYLIDARRDLDQARRGRDKAKAEKDKEKSDKPPPPGPDENLPSR